MEEFFYFLKVLFIVGRSKLGVEVSQFEKDVFVQGDVGFFFDERFSLFDFDFFVGVAEKANFLHDFDRLTGNFDGVFVLVIF